MAIAKNAVGGGNSIKEPGEYRVKVTEVKVDKSKKGDAMLVVTFMNTEEKLIRAYFVQKLSFHMEALATLKVAAGVDPKAAAGVLIGKELGILVEVPPPGEDGKSFSQIIGYGSIADLQAQGTGFAADPNEVPF